VAERLAFVDDPARLDELPPGFEPVAVTAAVAAAVDALPLDAEVDSLELEALGEETFERVLALCAAVDRAAGDEVVTARWRLLELKELYDGSLLNALGATRLAAAHGAREALVLCGGGSIAASALPPALGAVGVDVRTLLVPEPRAAPDARRRRAAPALRPRRAFRRGRPRILLLDEGYAIPDIAAELRRNRADVRLWLPPFPLAEKAHMVGLDLPAPLFRIAGVDLGPALAERLRRLAVEELAQDAAALRGAEAAIRRDRPDALLASTYAAPAAKAAAVAARRAGVPTVVARHGELPLKTMPLSPYQDLDVVAWALCWGDWEAGFVDRYAPQPVATAVVGSPLVERAAATALPRDAARRELGLRDDEIGVLFVRTSMSGDSWFAGHRTPPDLAHLRHQIEVVSSLSAARGLRTIVKELAVAPGPLEEWAARAGAAASFVRGLGFADLVNGPDAVVLDFPSTTLVQALLGTGRVYVVGHPVTVWEPGVVAHLERFGVRFVAPDEVGARLEADLEAGLLGAPEPFAPEAYEPLSADGPGTAASRAADAVMVIASEHAATTISRR